MSDSWKLMVDPDRLAKWTADGLNGTDILVMLTLCGHARSSMSCWPSNDRLAKRLRMSTRGVTKVLSKLKGLGKIELVYRDAEKRERYAIVMLERESDVYETPSVPADAMTVEWVDAVRSGGVGTGVPSRMNSSSKGVEPEFLGGWNSSSRGVGTPVPQNKHEENKYEVNKDSEKKIPPPTPQRPQEPSGLNGEGGTAFASGGEMPPCPKPTPQPKADPGQQPIVVDDVKPEPKPQAPSIPEAGHRLVQETLGDEGVKRIDEFIRRANGDPEIVLAACRAVKAAKDVRSPVGLALKKIDEFAASGKIPPEYQDRDKQRRIERAMDFGHLRLDITTHIRRRSNGKHSPAEIREEALRLIDDQSRKVGLTGEQTEKRIQFAQELLTDAEIASRQQTDERNAEREAKEKAEREARFTEPISDPRVLRMMDRWRNASTPKQATELVGQLVG